MAETIIFNIPTTVTYSNTITDVNWYQSDDGATWDASPNATSSIVSLPIGINGKYTWDNLNADANRYNLITFITDQGEELDNSLFLPPKPTYIKNAISGLLITDVQSYMLGESIELILRVDDAGIAVIGNSTNVLILDEFGNVITTLVANRVGSIYTVSWAIPLNLKDYYNPGKLPEVDSNSFILTDSWNLYGTTVNYSFYINRVIESPISNNSIIQISLDGISDNDGNILTKVNTTFSTKLTPYYASANDVKDVNRTLLDGYNDYTIARHIINYSRVVDLMMRPKVIYYQSTFDHAVRNFVKYKAAEALLLSVAQLNEEEKALDTFRYRASSAHPKDLLGPIEEQASKFALFIFAGGKDTPFISKNFEKGLFDPNRPNLARANFDNSGWFPWLNATSNSFTINVEGQNMEIRGERGIQYSYIMSRYLNSDLGDVGYLSGI